MVTGKYINLVKANIRYSKYQIIAIAILIILASMLINTSLFLFFNYNDSFVSEKARLNGEDIDFLYIDSETTVKNDVISEVLSECSEVSQFEIDNVVSNNGTIQYNKGKLFTKVTYMSFDRAEKKEIGKYEILEDNGGEGAYLSYLFKVDGGYKVGDEITVTLGTVTESFPVAGFYNNVDTGTINCTDIVVLLTDNYYDKVSASGENAYRISALVYEPDNADVIESEIGHRICDKVSSLIPMRSSSAIRLQRSRYITSTMLQAIISVASVLIITVLLAIISITLANYVRNNMRNLGTLKSLGYKSLNIILTIVAEFSIITIIMSAIGVVISYLILPSLSTALECQVGIPYQVRFMLPEAIASIAICTFFGAASSFVPALKIKNIAPILAIRDADNKKNLKRTVFPLEQTKLGLNTALALKNWLTAKARNLILLFSITGISFLLGFSCFVYQNIVIDSSEVFGLVFGNVADSVISVYTYNEDELVAEFEKNQDIDRYYMYTVGNVTPVGLPKMYSYIFDDEAFIDESRICVDGHLPQNESQIAINCAYSRKSNLNLGDSLDFSVGDEVKQYTVCGLTQGAASSGFDCYLLRKGASEIAPLKNVNYYVDLKGEQSIDDFNDSIASKCNLIYASNYKEMTETSSSSYMNILALSSIIVTFVSVMIAGFVLYVLVSVYLSNKKREHGILKSLGFVTGNIIYQTVASIMPTCIIATFAGLLLARKGASRILIMALEKMGIFKFGTPIESYLIIIVGVCTVVFTAAYTVLLSSKVRNITPHQLFNNE